jgi:hypothetical protein
MEPRLSKENQRALEQHFQGQQKPSMQIKKDLALKLGVSLPRINASDDPSLLPHVYDVLI